MRLAVISDIHGNLPALQAVLADIARQGVDQTVNLGDILSGPLLPAAARGLGRNVLQLNSALSPGAFRAMNEQCRRGTEIAEPTPVGTRPRVPPRERS